MWNRDKLFEYVKARLGHPCIDIELELERNKEFSHFDTAYVDAWDFITRYSSNEANFEDYVIVYTQTNRVEYILPPGVSEVIEGGRAWGNAITPWSTLQIGPGESLISLNGGLNFDLGTYVAAKTLLADAQKLIGLNYRFKYHKESRILRIIPTPREDSPIIIRVYRDESIEEVYSMINFRNLLVALMREQLGLILFKDDFTMPGGGRINGDKILAKAESDKKAAMDAIIAEAPRPYFMTDLDL